MNLMKYKKLELIKMVEGLLEENEKLMINNSELKNENSELKIDNSELKFEKSKRGWSTFLNENIEKDSNIQSAWNSLPQHLRQEIQGESFRHVPGSFVYKEMSLSNSGYPTIYSLYKTYLRRNI